MAERKIVKGEKWKSERPQLIFTKWVVLRHFIKNWARLTKKIEQGSPINTKSNTSITAFSEKK